MSAENLRLASSLKYGLEFKFKPINNVQMA